jgi:hypothetical protein
MTKTLRKTDVEILVVGDQSKHFISMVAPQAKTCEAAGVDFAVQDVIGPERWTTVHFMSPQPHIHDPCGAALLTAPFRAAVVAFSASNNESVQSALKCVDRHGAVIPFDGSRFFELKDARQSQADDDDPIGLIVVSPAVCRGLQHVFVVNVAGERSFDLPVQAATKSLKLRKWCNPPPSVLTGSALTQRTSLARL